MQSDNPFITLDRAVKLGYMAIDASDICREQKRSLLFSLYSFRALFDNAPVLAPDKILIRYGCSFLFELSAHPDYQKNPAYFAELQKSREPYLQGGGVYIRTKDGYRCKFDANSELFTKFVQAGKIVGENSAYIEKYGIYEMFLRLARLSSATDALRAFIYIIFPLAVTVGAPHDEELYDTLKKEIFTPRVFKTVLFSKDGDFIFDSEKEMRLSGLHPEIIDWYLPYIEYKNLKVNGRRAEIDKYEYYLEKNDFSYVLEGTERLLDSFPDDVEILLVNMAARTALAKDMTEEKRQDFLNQSLALVSDAMVGAQTKREYLLYYKGLCLLGLSLKDQAKDAFFEALEENPALGMAELMYKALNV